MNCILMDQLKDFVERFIEIYSDSILSVFDSYSKYTGFMNYENLYTSTSKKVSEHVDMTTKDIQYFDHPFHRVLFNSENPILNYGSIKGVTRIRTVDKSELAKAVSESHSDYLLERFKIRFNGNIPSIKGYIPHSH